MLRLVGAFWRRWRDAPTYATFMALSGLALLGCVLAGDLLGALSGLALGDLSAGFNAGAAVGGLAGAALLLLSPTGPGSARRRAALLGTALPASGPSSSPEGLREDPVVSASETRWHGSVEAHLLTLGFRQEGPAEVRGLRAQVFGTSRFRLRWLATRLHVFVFVIDARGVPLEELPQLAEACRETAVGRKKGLPRGLQTGVAAMPILTVSKATPAAAAWAWSAQPIRFAALLYPVVADVSSGEIYRRTVPQRAGRIYEHYLSETAARILG